MGKPEIALKPKKFLQLLTKIHIHQLSDQSFFLQPQLSKFLLFPRNKLFSLLCNYFSWNLKKWSGSRINHKAPSDQREQCPLFPQYTLMPKKCDTLKITHYMSHIVPSTEGMTFKKQVKVTAAGELICHQPSTAQTTFPLGKTFSSYIISFSESNHDVEHWFL